MFFDYLLEYNRYMLLIGMAVIGGLAVVLSTNRRAINWWLVLKAFIFQAGLGFLLIKVPAIEQTVIAPVCGGINYLFGYASEGSRFLFGNLIDCTGSWGFVFAFRVLPVIIFFAALTSVLFHFGVIQFVVSWLNRLIRPVLGTTGPETLSATGNIFLGQTEAPLLIKNYLPNMTRSELFVVMVSGMAHMSGAIMAVYATMGVSLKHMFIAAVMAVPGSILIAKMVLPEQEKGANDNTVAFEKSQGNVLAAIAQGTMAGLNLAMAIGAILLVFLALLPLVNDIIGWAGQLLNYPLAYAGIALPQLSLTYLLGLVFAPIAYLLGMTGTEALQAGQLLGTKFAINELIAFQQMVKVQLSDRAVILLTYCIGAFANFSSIGIQIAGIGELAPSKRAWLTELGMRALLAASLVNLLSACIIGLML